MSIKPAFATTAGARNIFVRPYPAGRRVPALLAGLALAGLASFASPTGAYAAAPKGYFVGNAYATSGTVTSGPLAASLGPTAYIPCPCAGTNGDLISNKLVTFAAGADGKLLRAKALLSTIKTTPTDNAQRSDNINRIEGFAAFNGLIAADSINAAAHVVATEKGVTTADTGSRFTNLIVAGKSVQSTVAPNTRINLPGLGYVILKRETTTGNGVKSASLEVDMIAVVITTANSFGLPIGAQVLAGHSVAGYVKGTFTDTYSGRAFATNLYSSVPGDLTVATGLLALQPLGCGGTGGKTATNSVSGVVLNPLMSIGTAVSTAYSKDAFAQTASSIENVTLLNGLISATGVKSVATTYFAKGVRVRSTDGTSLSKLKVLGVTLPVKIKPNTQVRLPGIGVVILNEQILPPADSNENTAVNGIHVFVTTKNLLGLPVGTQLVVGHADSGVTENPAGS